MKLNVGSGLVREEGYVNLDLDVEMKPHVVGEALLLPFKEGVFEQVKALHLIEHLPYRLQVQFLKECHRVLKDEGELFLEFPDTELCMERFLNNYKGQRDWWLVCIYGGQNSKYDFHHSPVIWDTLERDMYGVGFSIVKKQLNDYRGFARVFAKKVEPPTDKFGGKEVVL